jgi:hypothetical protein
MTHPVPRSATLSDAFAALVIFLSCAPAFAAPPTTKTSPTTLPADPDLVAWFRAADTPSDTVAPDLTPHRRHAKPVDGKLVLETVDGRRAFRLGGATGSRELVAPADPALDFTADFSVAARVRLAADQTNVVFLSKRTPGGDDGYTLAHSIGGHGGVGFIAAPRVVVPTPIKAAQTWLHVAVTFQRKDFILYVDGKAIGITELPATPVPSPQPLVLGASAGGKNAMDGWLDDVRIYHRGLTPAEVETLAAGREPDNPYTQLPPDEEKRVRTLIAQLGSDAYARRESAAKQLKDMGRKIFPLLREYRDTDDIEISSRVKSLLGELPKTETNK